METSDKKTYKYGTVCFEQSLGQFIVWFSTKDERSARIIHKCITNQEKSFLIIED